MEPMGGGNGRKRSITCRPLLTLFASAQNTYVQYQIQQSAYKTLEVGSVQIKGFSLFTSAE